MFPCHRLTPTPTTRRAFLRQASCGFGAVALAALWAQQDVSGAETAKDATDPLAPRQPQPLRSRCRHCSSSLESIGLPLTLLPGENPET